MTGVICGARIDLLFTMSDNTSAARQCRRRPNTISRERAFLHEQPPGGARRDRTDDLLLAKQALSQLSYGPLFRPTGSPSRSSRQLARPAFAALRRGSLHSLRERRLVGLGRFELPTSRLSSARSNQLSYKPEPGVSGQKPAIGKTSDCRVLITDSWSARSRRKRSVDGGVPPMGRIGLSRPAPMFPRDPIEDA